jgi:LysM repeat protein
MTTQKHKVKLSPRLQLGVGRSGDRRSLLPYATVMFLIISGVLAVRAGYMVIHRSPTVAPAQPQVLGAEDTADSQKLFKEYSVKKGDTIFSIGQQNNIDWTTLATLNGLEAPFKLQQGQVIKIPQQ